MLGSCFVVPEQGEREKGAKEQHAQPEPIRPTAAA